MSLLRGVDTVHGEAAFCRHCQTLVPDGPDACLGMIDGVISACCGHGGVTSAYVIPKTGSVMFGPEAEEYFKSLGRGAQRGTVWITKSRSAARAATGGAS